MSNSLRFLLDENVPKLVRRLLVSEGFSAEYADKGVTNGRLAGLAKEKAAVLVSRDSDFLNMSLFPPKEFSGIIVFIIHPPKAEKLVKSLSMLLADVKEFSGKQFAVGEEGFESSG